MFRRTAIGALLALMGFVAAAGCTGQQVTLSPGPTPATTTRLYVGSFGSTTSELTVFARPFSASSVPVATVPNSVGFAAGGGMNFDATSRLFIADASGKIFVFNQPISSSSTPAFTIADTTPEDVAFDSAGRLFVARPGIGIDVFTPPFSASSTRSFTIPDSQSPWGVAFDSAGNLLVSDIDFETKFSPPFSASSTPAATFGTEVHNCNFGLAVGPGGQLFVGDCGGIDVYNPPFTSSTTKAFTMPIGTVTTNGAYYPAFDSAGALYVAVFTPSTPSGQVWVYSPPFSASSTPAFKISAQANAYGVAIGP